MADDEVTITLSQVEWLRLCVVIKVMRDEARTNAAAAILALLGLKILDQAFPTPANLDLRDSLAAASR